MIARVLAPELPLPGNCVSIVKLSPVGGFSICGFCKKGELHGPFGGGYSTFIGGGFCKIIYYQFLLYVVLRG